MRVYANANVIRCDPLERLATSIAVEAGRVVAVGDEDSVLAAAGSSPQRIDLQGATVLPGMIDTHPHLMHFGALAEPLVDLGDAVSHRDIADRVARRARELPEGE